MQIGSELRTLQDLAAHLPFDLEDAEQANLAFQCWSRERRDNAKHTVELWTYCFVRRYYFMKFVREPAAQDSDFDELITKTYRKIERYVSTVDHPDRYAQWVSKICKNTFINYVRARRRLVPFDGVEHSCAEDVPIARIDFDSLHRALVGAVGRLPGFLQRVAQLRFVERRSYEEIERLTGKPLPVIRSYTSKALARFRQDSRLRACIESAHDDMFSG